jgi:FkbM family methyltransferase
MSKYIYTIISKILRKVINILEGFSDFINKRSRRDMSELLQEDTPKSLFKTRENIKLWLGGNSEIDKTIITYGLWEQKTTQLVKQLIHETDVVIDVGANIGYFTTLFAKLVGPEGKVYAFEPTHNYYNHLLENVSINDFKNIEIIKKGLSNLCQDIEISIDESSATIHQPLTNYVQSREVISLITLDEFILNKGISKINFIKIDVDGHEPFVLEGALKSIQKYKPIIILEISHLHYLEAGITAWDFYNKLKKWGFYIFYEDERKEILTKNEFLIKCGSFSESYNIILCLDDQLLNSFMSK